MLYTYNPIFENIPLESFIQDNQQKYYQTLNRSHHTNDPTLFVEFICKLILNSLKEYLTYSFESPDDPVLARLLKAKKN